MSTFTPITLKATIANFAGKTTYGEVDDTGLENQFETFDVSLSGVTTQTHADASSREPLLYNGLDISAGMFISDDSGNTIVRIVSISNKSETLITCVVEDTDMLSFRLNGINTVSDGGNVIIFGLNPEGEAIIVDPSAFLSGALDKINARFNLNEKDDRVKFTHDVAPAVNAGDIVTINSSGNLVKYGLGADVKVGIVLDILRNGKDVYVKPFNDIIRDYKNPESLSGIPTDVYYTNTSNPGEITTAIGGKATFLHLNTKIPTILPINSSTIPGFNDFITINGTTVFDGSNGDSVATKLLWSNKINNYSGTTNVYSAITQAPAVSESDDNTLSYTGSWAANDVFIPIGVTGSVPASYAEITISDGITTATIIFDTPDISINLGANYDIMSPAAIKAEFDATILANSLNIICTLYDSPTYNGQGIRLTSTNGATGITLVSINPDAFGAAVVGAGSDTGLSLSSTLGAETLTLTRDSGGPIEIDGTPNSGGYINQGGVVSSKSGRVPYLLLIEDEGSDGVTETGIKTYVDLNQSSAETTADGDPTGITITYTPYADSVVTVKINGIEVNLGDADLLEDCYFSVDGGTSARAMADITAGDSLYWNGSKAGYQLDASDDIDISYEKSSLD